MSDNNNVSTKVVTGLVRFSYLNILEPKSINGSKPKYSVSLIIPKSDKATLSKIHAAVKVAYEDGQGKLKGNGRVVPALDAVKTPLRDGDKERPGDEAYANSYFINASSSSKPGIVDANLQDILAPEEIYSGMFGRASINFYAYNINGNKGITCGLNNLQKLRDGERLGGRASAASDFATDYTEDFLS